MPKRNADPPLAQLADYGRLLCLAPQQGMRELEQDVIGREPPPFMEGRAMSAALISARRPPPGTRARKRQLRNSRKE